MSTEEIIADPHYKYVGDDISSVLRVSLRDKKQLNGVNCIFAPTREKENKLVALLSEEQENVIYSCMTSRTLFIPYLTEDNEDGHWVGIVINFENNIVTRVDYYDSLVRSMNSKLVQDLKQVYGDGLDKKIVEIQDNFVVQNDFSSSGPCTIENLVNAAMQTCNTLPVSEIRKNHILLMQKDPSGEEFCTRQQINHYPGELFFPRCEYKTRFQETSAFAMSDPDHWATYFRSTGGNRDRIAKSVKSYKTYKNKNINKSLDKEDTIPPAKSGCMKSPWAHAEYREIIYGNSLIFNETENKNDGTYLYDQLLQYKSNICKAVVKEFSILQIAERKIDVYFENDYPCIMVQIREFSELFKSKEQGSLYKIVMAYFTAITNSVAYNSKIPIELVIRASFGHNIPSVSDTHTSFRINIGIVPECYAGVLARSLEILNTKLLVPLLNRQETVPTLKLGFCQDEINHRNANVDYYNESKIEEFKIRQRKKKSKSIRKNKPSKVEAWNENDNLFNVLRKVGDSSGRKVSYQITRWNKYMDLIADYAHDQFLKSLDNTTDFAKPLREILKRLTYEDQVTVDNSHYNNNQFAFHDKESQDIENDQKFWEIIQSVSSIFQLAGTKDLSRAINSKKIKGLYKLLEKANLDFIRNSSYQYFKYYYIFGENIENLQNLTDEDGYGSSSDCEVEVENTRFYSRKIIVATGMRAINLSAFLAIHLAGTQNFDTDFMYYETGNVVQKLVQDINELHLSMSVQQREVKYIDLNHCASKGPNNVVDLEKIKNDLDSEAVVVLDYTSATTEKISEAIRIFIQKVPILLLLNSGIKNEQIGADMNPYGTLRIIARDKNDLIKLFHFLKINLISQEKLPREFHSIRKRYKKAGAVVENDVIYTENRGFNYDSDTEENDDELQDFEEDDPKLSNALKKVAYLFSNDRERNNLTEYHGMDLRSIISWGIEKMEFLGSNDVIDVIDRFDDDGDIFNQIKKCYGRRPDLARQIVAEILSSQTDELDMDFSFLEENFESYSNPFRLVGKFGSEEDICLGIYLEYSPSDENIIDVIVREMAEPSISPPQDSPDNEDWHWSEDEYLNALPSNDENNTSNSSSSSSDE